jgi:hypothetical protein
MLVQEYKRLLNNLKEDWESMQRLAQTEHKESIWHRALCLWASVKHMRNATCKRCSAKDQREAHELVMAAMKYLEDSGLGMKILQQEKQDVLWLQLIK